MTIETRPFEAGSLWARMAGAAERALESGALRPITTEGMVLRDCGVDFHVRIVSSLARKAEEKRLRAEKAPQEDGNKPNPFLPYEKEMFVGDISDTHLCLLNKFNVIDHHLLIVTRVFEDQGRLLTVRDFEAVCACMAEFEGLAFYNGGTVAGASQRHKHLQMVPLPLAQGGAGVPTEPLFKRARFQGDLAVVPGLPFGHSFARLWPRINIKHRAAPRALASVYRRMLQTVGLNPLTDPEDSVQTGPYNMLFTRKWMLLVPRSREFFGSISINALGFSGGFLVKNQREMALLEERGCMAALEHTAIKA